VGILINCPLGLALYCRNALIPDDKLDGQGWVPDEPWLFLGRGTEFRARVSLCWYSTADLPEGSYPDMQTCLEKTLGEALCEGPAPAHARRPALGL